MILYKNIRLIPKITLLMDERHIVNEISIQSENNYGKRYIEIRKYMLRRKWVSLTAITTSGQLIELY